MSLTVSDDDLPNHGQVMRRWDLISSFVSFVMMGSSSLLSLADLYMV